MSKRKLPRAIVAEEPALTLGYAAPENRDNVIEIASRKDAPVPPAPEPEPRATNVDGTRRRATALAIVNHHAAFSALGGCIPLPWANFASVSALLVLRFVNVRVKPFPAVMT
jgi:hypothetical protein